MNGKFFLNDTYLKSTIYVFQSFEYKVKKKK